MSVDGAWFLKTAPYVAYANAAVMTEVLDILQCSSVDLDRWLWLSGLPGLGPPARGLLRFSIADHVIRPKAGLGSSRET